MRTLILDNSWLITVTVPTPYGHIHNPYRTPGWWNNICELYNIDYEKPIGITMILYTGLVYIRQLLTPF